MPYRTEAGKRGKRIFDRLMTEKIITLGNERGRGYNRIQFTITNGTRSTIKQYASWKQAKGNNEKTLAKDLYCICLWLGHAPQKDILAMSKEEFEETVGKIQASAYAAKTKRVTFVTIAGGGCKSA